MQLITKSHFNFQTRSLSNLNCQELASFSCPEMSFETVELPIPGGYRQLM